MDFEWRYVAPIPCRVFDPRQARPERGRIAAAIDRPIARSQAVLAAGKVSYVKALPDFLVCMSGRHAIVSAALFPTG